MANIAVFRVTRKNNRKVRKISGIFVGILCLLFLITILWLFSKISVASYNSIKFRSTNFIQSTDSIILKGFIEDTLPAMKPSNKSSGKIGYSSTLDGLTQKVLPVDVFDCKSVLNYQFPILQAYNSESLTGKDLKSNGQDELNNRDSFGENPVESLDDEAEKQINTDQTEKIYKPSTIVKSGEIAIRNHTSYKLDIEKLRKESLKLGSSKKNTQAIILHTHTSEAYSPSAKNTYTPSDPYRTENPKYNVVKVGEELNTQLSKLGIKAAHDTTIHDYPTYTGSYKRSLQTAIKNMKQYPNAKIVLDIHRDAYGGQGEKLRTAVKIGNTEAAKLMFVVGTDQMGLEHDNWRENLKFVIKLQENANKLYPGLCKEIDLRTERFNQHVAPGAIIIEVGSTGNTLEEAAASMKYLAKVIAEVVK